MRSPGGPPAPAAVALPVGIPVALPAMTALAPAARRSWVEQVMGMPVSILVRGPLARSPGTAVAVAAVFDELRRVDAVFSTYRRDSDVCRLDRGELREAECDPLVAEVLALADHARERTNGLFDVRRPGPDGRRHVDPSGLVKGWAAERAGRHLAAIPGHDWVLNVGGDIVASAAVASPQWRVGVEDPHDRAALLSVLTLAAGGLATSGSAARGNHVVDPGSGEPATTWVAVSVTGPSLLWADVYATAALVAGAQAPGMLASLRDYQALLVAPDGSRQVTPGWPGVEPGRH